ncbi:hypothetical protein AALB39_07780 [Lachnospiraceae bacterium 54-53]
MTGRQKIITERKVKMTNEIHFGKNKSKKIYKNMLIKDGKVKKKHKM